MDESQQNDSGSPYPPEFEFKFHILFEKRLLSLQSLTFVPGKSESIELWVVAILHLRYIWIDNFN